MCELHLPDPDRQDLWVRERLWRTPDRFQVVVTVEADKAVPQVLWHAARALPEWGLRSPFDRIATFVPLGETRGQVILRGPGGYITALAVVDGQVQSLLSDHGAEVWPIGDFVVTGGEGGNGGPGEFKSLYEFRDGSYQLVEDVLFRAVWCDGRCDVPQPGEIPQGWPSPIRRIEGSCIPTQGRQLFQESLHEGETGTYCAAPLADPDQPELQGLEQMQRRENAVWDVLTIQAKGAAAPLWQEVSRADHRVCCLEWFQFQGENRAQLLYVESNCLKYTTPCPGRVVVMTPDGDHVRQLMSFDNAVVTTVLPIGHYLFTRSRRDPTEGVAKASSIAIYEWTNDAYHFVDQVELQRAPAQSGEAAIPPWGDDEGMAHDHEAPDGSLPPRRG